MRSGALLHHPHFGPGHGGPRSFTEHGSPLCAQCVFVHKYILNLSRLPRVFPRFRRGSCEQRVDNSSELQTLITVSALGSIIIGVHFIFFSILGILDKAYIPVEGYSYLLYSEDTPDNFLCNWDNFFLFFPKLSQLHFFS